MEFDIFAIGSKETMKRGKYMRERMESGFYVSNKVGSRKKMERNVLNSFFGPMSFEVLLLSPLDWTRIVVVAVALSECFVGDHSDVLSYCM